MARYYQSYLAEHGGLPEAQPAASAEAPVNTPFYLELVGGITKTKHVLGIPYQSLEALTTFEEAQSILEQMKQRGIDHIKLKYAGWFNRGLDHKVPDRLSVDQAIGGSKGLNRLAAYAKEQDIQLFLTWLCFGRTRPPASVLIRRLPGCSVRFRQLSIRTIWP